MSLLDIYPIKSFLHSIKKKPPCNFAYMEIDLGNIKGKIIKPQEGFQTDFASSDIDVVWGGGILAAGKATTLDTRIVTPFGLRELRDIKVGDIISNPETGGQERVIFLHPIQTIPYYKITFVDGTSAKCSAEHLWKIRRTGKKTKKYNLEGEREDWRIWTTQMMFDFLEKAKHRRHTNYGLSIPITEAVQFTRPVTPTTPRDIPPYILGVLIGDGCFTQSAINSRFVSLSTPDEFIVERFKEYGYDMSHVNREESSCPTYYIYNKKLRDDLKVLKLAGHGAKDKFIPKFYKYATITERKELLKGLIDTDGYVEKDGHIIYTTISKQLAEDVAFVVRSIGGKASVKTKEAGYKDKQGNYHLCNLAYYVYISTRNNEEIVSLPKKLCRIRNIGYNINKKYYFEKRIEKIETIGLQEGRCITVDNPSGLYLIDDFLVTHNSYALVLAMAEALMTDPDFRCLISRRSLQNLKAGGGFVEKFKQIFGEYCSIKESDNPRASFPNGSFCDLTYIDDSDMVRLRERAKGWEYDVIAIDEMTEMSFECFCYIMTRNRGNSKTFTGHIFATLNPKRSHWSRQFLDWYIGNDGFIIPERNGVVRYFYVNGTDVKDVVWGDSKEEVYKKCKIDIDRKLRAVGGNYTYENLIKSFVFYQGKLSENKAMLDGNANYIGSVAASGGKTAQALLEGNFNVDPEEDEKAPITSEAARTVFANDPQINPEKWVTVDLADYGKDNLVAFAWNGFHIVDMMILTHSTPRGNANSVRIFAQENGVAESHIIYDGTNARYFNDYIPDAICYYSSKASFGMYKNQAPTVKDMCYLRLVKMINDGGITMDEKVSCQNYIHQEIHHSITVGVEFMEECSVVRFKELPNGGKKLLSKIEMNKRLGRNRSMDVLDPCAMRMYPCANIPYGEELQQGFECDEYEEELSQATGNGSTVNVYDASVWC